MTDSPTMRGMSRLRTFGVGHPAWQQLYDHTFFVDPEIQRPDDLHLLRQSAGFQFIAQ